MFWELQVETVFLVEDECKARVDEGNLSIEVHGARYTSSEQHIAIGKLGRVFLRRLCTRERANIILRIRKYSILTFPDVSLPVFEKVVERIWGVPESLS